MNVKEWFKKCLPWLVAIISAIAAFIVGRKSLSGTIADYERLRRSFDELQRLLQDSERKVAELRKLKSDSDEQLYNLGGEIKRARAEIELLRAGLESNEGNIEELDSAIERLRSLTETYRTELEAIQVIDNSNG